MTWQPTYLQELTQWMANPHMYMYGRWNSPQPGGPGIPGEGGVDLTAPIGTPVYALGTGPLLAASTFASQGYNHPGAVVAQRVDVPGVGTEDIYYQHIDISSSVGGQCLGGNCQGRVLQKGQLIGTVGSAGETEIGFNPIWGSMYGPVVHPGLWPTDPRPWIIALVSGDAPPASNNPDAGTPNPQTSTGPKSTGPNQTGFAQKAGIFIGSLVLVVFGAFLLFKPQVEAVAKRGLEVGAVAV